MLTTNDDMVLRYMFTDFKEGDWEWRDASQGDGPQFYWNRPEPTPTDEEVEAKRIEMLAAQEATKWSPEVLQAAGMFRVLLRKHFGPEAETNHAITEASVKGYFATATGLSGDDVRDGIFLDKLFSQLAPLCAEGKTWNFPWEKLA